MSRPVVHAGMATFPEREGILERVLRAVLPQVDRLTLVLNEFGSVPDWLAGIDEVDVHRPERDLKDTGKFLFAAGAGAAGASHVFTFDDDILYPPDYVERTIAAYDALPPGDWIAGYHGTVYRPPPSVLERRFWRRDRWRNRHLPTLLRDRRTFDFSRALSVSRRVDQIGTGTLVTRPDLLPAFAAVEDAARFVDVRVARLAAERGIAMACLRRAEDWLRPAEAGPGIYGAFTRTAPTPLIDEIRAFALRRDDAGAAL